MNSNESLAMQNLILRAPVGSTIHGTMIEGTDDRDEMGVCIEPPEYVIGTRNFEQWVHRTATQRGDVLAPGESPRSQPGDLDLVVYSLRKYCRLALKGNPTILTLLFIPEESLIQCSLPGTALRKLASAFLSREVGKAFLGYMVSQRMRLEGERGGMRVHRTELVERFGFDTKYAGHVIRLGFQGIELLSTERLMLPMPEEARKIVRDVRVGTFDLQWVLTKAGELERELRDLIDTTALPLEPDFQKVNEFLVRTHQDWWRTQGLIVKHV